MKVFIGYDPKEDVAYRVCEASIKFHQPTVDIIPLNLQELRNKGLYWREKDLLGSTEFTITRFLVPYLSNYTGWSLFCDCDFLWTVDINNILNYIDDRYAVMLVKHNFTPKNSKKMDGKIQSIYPRKNWSSMVLWNCNHIHNTVLNLDLINTADPSFLHQFKWIPDSCIGSLDKTWNWLVGWYKEENFLPNAIHFTEGGPWFKEFSNISYSKLWFDYYNRLVAEKTTN